MSVDLATAPPPCADVRRRAAVSIAGYGAVTSIGATTDETFEAMCAGHSGLALLRGFDRSRFRARHAYEIDDRPSPGSEEPGRATRWLIAAIEEAADDAGLTDISELPVVIGTGLRELRSAELSWTDGAALDAAQLDFRPALRRHFGTTRVYSFANACSASLYALALACDLLLLDEAPMAVVAGVDTITASMFGLLDRVQLVSPESLRPLERDSKGVLMGDGAAAAIVRRDDAGHGGRGRLRTVSVNADAFHVTAPASEGIAQAIRDAHAEARVRPQDIDLILLHGTGTRLNDKAETQAVAAVFGNAGGGPAMTALKSSVGHTSGASGLLSLIVALRAIEAGRIPPTLGLENPIDGASNFDIVRGEQRLADPRLAEVHAFGFGGVNAVAIVEGETR
jgi:3-oxoacyl-[acyl-carrier-protein] synthase II